eukprot:3366977-Pyramimonas_sp.AAC.1
MAAAQSNNDAQEGCLSPAAPPPGSRNPLGPLSGRAAQPVPPPARPAPKSSAKPSDFNQIRKGGEGASD